MTAFDHAGGLPFVGTADVDDRNAGCDLRLQRFIVEIGEFFPLDAQQFDLEPQCRVRRNDAPGSAGPVGEFRRNDEFALAADLHAFDALFPAGNDPFFAEGKGKRRAAIDT